MRVSDINKAKTKCPRGHDYATHATVTKAGFRRCRICDMARKRAERARAKALREAVQ